ncbi:MAG TPA: hypothetical protein VKM55_18015 [Candidatus Lokiarchaeia archaeon]|nr:hypothetical protein [Candidatus Lokiarchaeia archaeon]
MEKFRDVNWSAIARDAILKKIEDLEFLDYFTSESEIDDEMAIEMGSEVSRNMSKRHSCDE